MYQNRSLKPNYPQLSPKPSYETTSSGPKIPIQNPKKIQEKTRDKNRSSFFIPRTYSQEGFEHFFIARFTEALRKNNASEAAINFYREILEAIPQHLRSVFNQIRETVGYQEDDLFIQAVEFNNNLNEIEYKTYPYFNSFALTIKIPGYMTIELNFNKEGSEAVLNKISMNNPKGQVLASSAMHDIKKGSGFRFDISPNWL